MKRAHEVSPWLVNGRVLRSGCVHTMWVGLRHQCKALIRRFLEQITRPTRVHLWALQQPVLRHNIVGEILLPREGVAPHMRQLVLTPLRRHHASIVPQSCMSRRNCVKVTVTHSTATWVQPAIQDITRLINRRISIITQKLNSVSCCWPVEILLSGTRINQWGCYPIGASDMMWIISSQDRRLLKIRFVISILRSCKIILQVFAEIVDTIIYRIQFAIGCHVSVALLLFELCHVHSGGIPVFDGRQKIQGLVCIIAPHIWPIWRDWRYVELAIILQSHHFLIIPLSSLNKRSWLVALNYVGVVRVRRWISDQYWVARQWLLSTASIMIAIARLIKTAIIARFVYLLDYDCFLRLRSW